MGVVRREGDWRLEKTGAGVYDITFQRETQVRVVTPDAPIQDRNAPVMGATPVREVGSYSEAEGLFEEHVHGPPPLGAWSSATGSGIGGGSLDDLDASGIDLEEVPPIGYWSWCCVRSVRWYVDHSFSNSRTVSR